LSSFRLLCLIVFITLAFEFTNGWHDAASSIATIVSTRVLRPLYAVAWAAFWNFIAAFFLAPQSQKQWATGSSISSW
jgi:PiT family inorganic phosphate transporter